MSTKSLTATTDVITFRQQSPFKRVGAELLKYSALLLITFIFAFPLFWMVTSALKSDPQVYTLATNDSLIFVGLMVGPAWISPRWRSTQFSVILCRL